MVIIGGRCLYSAVVFHLGRTDRWGMFGLGFDWWEEGHSLNWEHNYKTRSTSTRTAVIPNVPSRSRMSCNYLCQTCHLFWWGQVVVAQVMYGPDNCQQWRLLLVGNITPFRPQLDSRLDFPFLLFVFADSDVTPTRCFPSLWWKDHHGWHFLSCSTFLTV